MEKSSCAGIPNELETINDLPSVPFPLFSSASGQPAIDSTAEYYNQSYPPLGQTNARLEFSPDGNTLLIADTERDLIYLLYTTGNGTQTQCK